MRSSPQVAPDCVVAMLTRPSCSMYSTCGWCRSALSCPALSTPAKPFSAFAYTYRGWTPAAAATPRGSAPSFRTTMYELSMPAPEADSTGAAADSGASGDGWSAQAATAASSPNARKRVERMGLRVG